MSGTIAALWKSQPGKYFCICTKTLSGKWEEHFFKKDEHLARRVKTFVEEKQKRHDMYFCPHGFTRKVRQKEFAVLPRMLWADLDEVDPKNLGKLKPTIAIESSPGRFVGLWLTDAPVSEDLNRRMTYHLGADHGGWDLTQVLRVPRTINFKYDNHPKVIKRWDDGPVYTVDQLEHKLPKIKVSTAEGSVADVLRKYPDIPRLLIQRLYKDKPTKGKRSEVFWKLGQELVNEGVKPDDMKIFLKGSVWNKFADRPHSEDAQLEREIQKLYNSKGRTQLGEDEEEDEKHGVLEKGKRPKFFQHSLEEVEEETKEWIWYPFLARGEVTIIEGEPECGKSYACQMVSKAICDGEILPTMKREARIKVKGKVLYCDVENDKATVTKPRLRWNGLKNMDNFYQEDFPFTIEQKDMMRALMKAIEHHEPELVVFDTLNHYIGSADTAKANEMAQAITTNFREIARRFDCAVIIIRHWRKSGRKEGAKNQGQGSIAILGTVRIVVGVTDDPEDSGVKRLFLIKNNFTGPFEKSRALELHIEGKGTTKELNKSVARWGDFIEATAEQLVQAEIDQGAKTMTNDAMAFLYDLSEDHDEMRASKIIDMAEKKGFKEATLKRAAMKLGLKKERRKENGVEYSVWMLDDLPAVQPV